MKPSENSSDQLLESYRQNLLSTGRFALTFLCCAGVAAVVEGMPLFSTLRDLAFLSAFIAMVMAAMRGEPPLSKNLNRWDEATALTTCALFAGLFNVT